jgi:hypothetical protein
VVEVQGVGAALLKGLLQVQVRCEYQNSSRADGCYCRVSQAQAREQVMSNQQPAWVVDSSICSTSLLYRLLIVLKSLPGRSVKSLTWLGTCGVVISLPNHAISLESVSKSSIVKFCVRLNSGTRRLLTKPTRNKTSRFVSTKHPSLDASR